MITPMDPLFVLLFATWTIEKDHYKTIYDLLTQVKALWWLELNHHAEMIRQICDIQRGTEDEMPENQYIKPNETKISTWLETKVSSQYKINSIVLVYEK
jgi:hypothetical protein